MRPTTEALKLGDDSPPDESKVFSQGDIYGVKGKTFTESFMANYVIPTRKEMAMMLMASRTQAGEEYGEQPDQMLKFAEECFKQADAFLAAEFATLDVEAYFQVYLNNGPADMGSTIEDVMKAAVANAQNYSA